MWCLGLKTSLLCSFVLYSARLEGEEEKEGILVLKRSQLPMWGKCATLPSRCILGTGSCWALCSLHFVFLTLNRPPSWDETQAFAPPFKEPPGSHTFFGRFVKNISIQMAKSGIPSWCKTSISFCLGYLLNLPPSRTPFPGEVLVWHPEPILPSVLVIAITFHLCGPAFHARLGVQGLGSLGI